MNKHSFLDEVLKHIRPKDAKKIVSKELEQHVNNNIKQFLQVGETEIAAEQKAVEQMGSPHSLGIKFNKLYKPKMDWVLVFLFLLALGLGTLPLIVIDGDTLHLNWLSKLGSIIACKLQKLGKKRLALLFSWDIDSINCLYWRGS